MVAENLLSRPGLTSNFDMKTRILAPAILALSACAATPQAAPRAAAPTPPAPTPTAASAAAPAPVATQPAAPPAKPDARASFAAWLKERLPEGGELVDGKIVHVAQKGDTWQSIAKAYVDLTEIYF